MTGLRVWLHPSSRTVKLSLVVGRWSLVVRRLDFANDQRRTANDGSYTLRRFGGRQPLCGIGVTSRIERTSIPDEASARTADSRPDPGPLTRTSTVRTP